MQEYSALSIPSVGPLFNPDSPLTTRYQMNKYVLKTDDVYLRIGSSALRQMASKCLAQYIRNF